MIKEGLGWLKRNMIDNRCVVISDRQRAPYPEVTGYWIPTLLNVGEIALAENFARFLVSIQNPDGSFSLQNTDEKFVFDTGQIIRGWAAIAPRLPEVREPMRKACEWIIAGADPATGKFKTPPPGGAWKLGSRGEVSEAIHIYIIQPMRDAAEVLEASEIRQAADRALKTYITTLDFTHFDRPNALTHFYAYIQEGLIETGHRELAFQGMQSVAKYQQGNGAVPGYFDVPWVCSTGLAQLAKVWYMLGDEKRAGAALAFVSQLQNYTGGFYGSYGPGADYFSGDELSWAVKYAIDAELASIEKHFDATVGLYAPVIPLEDGRAQAILSACKGAKRILDAGCGKGRYAALVKQTYPDADVSGTDISPEMLSFVPKSIKTKVASFQDMPFPDCSFDVVYCIEALEHAPNPQAAIDEMGRMVGPGGRLVIIDKNAEKLGTLQIEKWEKWFFRDELAGMLNDAGFDCAVSSLSYDGRPDDGLFLCWKGTKKVAPEVKHKPDIESRSKASDSNLTPEEWHDKITAEATPDLIARLVSKSTAHLWIAPIMEESAENDELLELGSGKGELSAQLAYEGRKTALMDFSEQCLGFSKNVYEKLGLKGRFIKGDVLEKLPLEDRSVDIVWSSGLLEHFSDENIAHIVAESARVARKKVISLVPNANSKPYRIGKEFQEREGRWPWGKEDPKKTLKPVFEAAGLRRVREYSIAPEHALNFLDTPAVAPIRAQMAKLFASCSPQELKDLNQGYLLVTVGEIDAARAHSSPSKKNRRLVCVPNDPLSDYAHYQSLEKCGYFNPCKMFDEVYCISPFETREYDMFGMHVIPTRFTDFADRVRHLNADCVRAYDLPVGMIACAGRVENVPVICSVHDVNRERITGPMPNADYFLAISGAVEEFLLQMNVDPKRIVKFTNRVNLDIFRPIRDEARKAAFIKRYPGTHRILHVGRIDKQKNQETLIAALSLLDKDYTAIFIGRGDVEPYKNLARQLKVEDRCTFVESVPHDELADYYNFCDCFCTPSRWEGFGIVFIEALACGAAVVTSDIRPMNEYIQDGENGILVQNYIYAEDLAEAIKRSVRDETLRERIRRNAIKAAQPFSHVRVETWEREIYEKALRDFGRMQ